MGPPGKPVDPTRCPGYKNGCFFSRRLFPLSDYGYCCKRCRVLAPNVVASGNLSLLCIKCFYEDPACPCVPCPCKKLACQTEMAEVEQRFANGQVDLSSSAEGPPMASTGGAAWYRAAPGPPEEPRVPLASTGGAAEASTGGAGSSRDDQNVLRMIQALQDEVGELKEKVTRMQAHIEQLEPWSDDEERHREWVDQPWHRERVGEEQPWHREWTAWAGRGEWQR